MASPFESYQYLHLSLREECHTMAAYLWADYLGQYIPELHKTLRSILMYGSKAAYIKIDPKFL